MFPFSFQTSYFFFTKSSIKALETYFLYQSELIGASSILLQRTLIVNFIQHREHVHRIIYMLVLIDSLIEKSTMEIAP